MAGSGQTTSKKDREKRKQQQRKEKEEKRKARKDEKGKSFEDMIAYVDEYGRLSSTPPEKRQSVNAEDMQISIPKRDDSIVEDTVRTGTVSFFNDSKGYGFIKDAGSGESIFVHATALLEQVTEGNKVSFEIENGPKGPVAVRVSIIR
jgi:cold shock CspA family protein